MQEKYLKFSNNIMRRMSGRLKDKIKIQNYKMMRKYD